MPFHKEEECIINAVLRTRKLEDDDLHTCSGQHTRVKVAGGDVSRRRSSRRRSHRRGSQNREEDGASSDQHTYTHKERKFFSLGRRFFNPFASMTMSNRNLVARNKKKTVSLFLVYIL